MFFCSAEKKKQQRKRHKEGDNVLISASANGYLFTAVFRQLTSFFFNFTNEGLITGLLGLFFHAFKNKATDILQANWIGPHYAPTQLQWSNA